MANWLSCVLVRSEIPRLFTPPARNLTPETSHGFEVVSFAEDVLGVQLMPWQRWLLIHGLELAADGTFRFRTLLVMCARQNGKTVLLQILALWRIYVDRSPLVIGTAQNLSLAEESWDGAVSMAEGVPDLAAEVAHVSRVNGAKQLRLTTGQRYGVTTASRRGARGLSSDLVLLDELREHRDYEAWGAITKTTMARPSPQIVGFSNAGDAGSIVLADLRAKALAAFGETSSSLGLFEWSAPDDCEIDDPEAWAGANPALGHRMTVAAIRGALETDPDTVFRTEVLCQWVTAGDAAIPAGVWASLADGLAARDKPVMFALDVAPDHSHASIAAAWRRPDTATQVMLTDDQPGVDWIVERAKDLIGQWGGRIIVKTTGTAGFLIPTLEREGVPVEGVTRRFYADACSALDAAISSGQLRHGNQDRSNDAVAVARWSALGDAGQRVSSRKDPRVSPLVAAALALYSLTENPARSRFLIL